MRGKKKEEKRKKKQDNVIKKKEETPQYDQNNISLPRTGNSVR
jgi:hypothetical protein